MVRASSRYRRPFAIAVAVLLPLLVYRANAASMADANLLDRLVLLLTSPLERVLSGAVVLVSDAWDRYVDVVGARRENAELRLALLEAERDRDRLEMLEAENARLERLLFIAEENPSVRAVSARVIGAGSSVLSRSVDIDKGAVDGLLRGATVVGPEGLVGMVRRVAWTSAEVLLIADEKVSFRGVSVRSRARGRISGAGLQPRFALVLGEVLRSDDLRVGDRIETSGIDGVFPKGVPVGVVVEVSDDPGQQHRRATLEPYVDFARIEEVTVLISPPRPPELVTPEPLLPPSLRSLDGGVLLPELPDAGTGDAGSAPRRPRPLRDAAAQPEPEPEPAPELAPPTAEPPDAAVSEDAVVAAPPPSPAPDAEAAEPPDGGPP